MSTIPQPPITSDTCSQFVTSKGSSDCAPSGRLELGHGGVCLLGPDVVHEDFRARLRERVCSGEADPLAGAGDQGALASEVDGEGHDAENS